MFNSAKWYAALFSIYLGELVFIMWVTNYTWWEIGFVVSISCVFGYGLCWVKEKVSSR